MKSRKNAKGMKTPPFLRPGDRIAIVAPARWVTKEQIAPALATIEQWGFESVVYTQVYKKNHQFAGSDVARASALQKALDDPSVKAVVFARGGYGTVRVLPLLDFRRFVQKSKWIVGFSDITALHSYINRQLGIKTLHAPMAVHFSEEKKSDIALHLLKDILTGKNVEYSFPSHLLNRAGTCKGELIGGNLSVMYSLRGTPADIDSKGKILFLEDVDEYLYHIDRMMMNLKYSGVLKDLKGLVVGAFSDMKDNTVPFGKSAERIILEAVKEYNYPVAFGFPAGHVKENWPLVMGSYVSLKIANRCKLEFC